MTRNQLVKSIVEETGYDKEMVANVLESFEYKVMDAIATEDTLQFAFGKFWGETKDPYKITGFYSTFEKIRALEGWSQAKLGYPHFKFSKQALICLKVRPREYFEQPENRYTSLARKFRKDLNIPEIAEYKDLPEEKIEELCKQADVEKHGEISSSRARFLRRHNNWNKKRDAARDEIKAKILIDEDLQKQLDNGVAEEDLVVRPIEEIKADKEKDNYGIVRWSDINSNTDSKIDSHNTNPDAHKEVFNTKVDKRAVYRDNKWVGSVNNNDGIAVALNTSYHPNGSETLGVTAGASVVAQNKYAWLNAYDELNNSSCIKLLN